MSDFILHGATLKAVSNRARERVRKWPFGSTAFDLSHTFGQPLKTIEYEFQCSRDFMKRITEGMSVHVE